MKNYLIKATSLAFALFLMCQLSHGLAQRNDASATETEDRVIITEDEIKVKSPRSYDQNFEVFLSQPKVTGLKNAKLLKKLQDTLSLKNIFNESRDEMQESIREGEGTGNQGVGYRINYNQHYLLDITFYMETMGAYPSNLIVHKIINLKTGQPLKASEAFNQPMFNQLLEKIKDLKKAEEKKALEDPYKSKDEREETLECIESANEFREYSLKNLDDFEVSDKGVTFRYDYEFRHASQALQPDSWYFISYEDLKSFINPKGPLSVFVNKS